MLSNHERGGRKTAATLKAKDPDYYRKLGALGGRNGGSPKGLFAHGKVSPSEAGLKGGRNGRRGPSKPANLSSPYAAENSLSTSKSGLWIADNSEFGEGFDQPGWKDKLSRRFK